MQPSVYRHPPLHQTSLAAKRDKAKALVALGLAFRSPPLSPQLLMFAARRQTSEMTISNTSNIC